jgi:hypothetical protein
MEVQPNSLSEDEIRDRDKRLAAAHEAGHFVVASFFGQPLTARIEKSESTDLTAERAWVGQVETETGDWTPTVAVAGELAVALVEEPDYWNNLESLADDVLDEINEDPDFLSPTDRASFPDDRVQQRAAIAEAAEILRNNHAFFVWATHELYHCSEITGARFAMACEFENNNSVDWQHSQLQLLLNRFNQLVAEVKAEQKSKKPSDEKIAAAEAEAGRLKGLLERVANRINRINGLGWTN